MLLCALDSCCNLELYQQNLTGDWLYGTEDPSLIPRPALHSYRLRLLHPVTHRWLDVTAPLPEDMRRLLPPDCDPA